jgi:formate dehydrogenase (NADP+) beta subunit
VVAPFTPVQNVTQVENVPVRLRRIMPLADSLQTAHGQELEKGFDSSTAHSEAERCLRCGLICYLRKKEENIQEAAVAG